MGKFVNFFDGYTTNTTPIVTQVDRLLNYPDDATFESNVAGSPLAGNIYFNTTDDQIRYYDGTQWDFVPDGITFTALVASVNTNTSDITTINNSIGAANGIAELDSGGKVPTSQLPDSVLGAMQYQGTWNADTNTPTLGDSGTGGTKGHYFIVNVAGNTVIDGSTDWQVGDWIAHNGVTWDKIDNSDKVSSVNGQTGVVVLDNSDIGLGNVTNQAQLTRLAGDFTLFPTKSTPDDADWVLVEDSQDTFEKKKVSVVDIRGASDLDGLTDVTITSPTEGQIIKYNNTSSQWENAEPPSTSPTTTEGDLIVRGATEDERLPIDNAGKVLTSNGTTAEWKEAPVTGLDSFYSENFEGSVTSANFVTGNDPIFNNGGFIDGAISDETTTPISKTKSLKYIMGASSSNDYVKSPDITIDNKQSGNTVGLGFYYTYDGDDGDIKIVAYDATNNEVLNLATDTLRAASNPQRFSVQFPIPTNTTIINWGFQVVTGNSAKEFLVDDIQISTNPFVSKDMLLPDKKVVGRGNGGTSITANVTNIDFTEVEDDLGLWNGTQFTADEKADYLVTGGVLITANTIFSLFAYIDGVKGDMLGRNAAADVTDEFGGIVHLEAGEVLSIRTDAGFTLSNSTTNHHITIKKIPTASEKIIAYNSRNAENSMVRLHTGNGYGSVNQRIPRFVSEVDNIGSAISYTDSATEGAKFTIEENGLYYVSYCSADSTNGYLGISLNSTQLSVDIVSITSADILTSDRQVGTGDLGSTSWSGVLSKGDIIRPHNGTVGTFTSSLNIFTISKIGVGDLLGVPTPRTAYIKDVKSSGSNGGSASTNTVQTRDLNTLEGDTEFVSLSSNQFTLEQGKYEIEAQAPAYTVNRHQLFLYNVTDSTYDLDGVSSFSEGGSADGRDVGRAKVEGTIIITQNKTYELRHWTQTAAATNGLGINANGTNNPQSGEVFSVVKIKKIS